MNDHYYSVAPESAHRFAECDYTYRGQKLTFVTDAGVFSRGEMDFGTDVLLKALPEKMTGRVLDIGCGWGGVGVSVGKANPECEIVMTDVNERAVGLAVNNAGKNGVKVQAVQGDGLENVTGGYDYVITNPPIRAGKETIYRLFREGSEHMNAGGEMYIVIRKQQGAESALKYLRTLFAPENVETVDKSGGFWVIRCRKG